MYFRLKKIWKNTKYFKRPAVFSDVRASGEAVGRRFQLAPADSPKER
jgi:hypothetical protein